MNTPPMSFLGLTDEDGLDPRNLEDYKFEAYLAECVIERGAPWMDEQDPEWFTKINTEHLTMSSGYSCICGQAFLERVNELECFVDNGFDYAWRYLMMDDPNAPPGSFEDTGFDEYGFTTPSLVVHGLKYYEDVEQYHKYDDEKAYEFLAIVWIEQIEKRKANA